MQFVILTTERRKNLEYINVDVPEIFRYAQQHVFVAKAPLNDNWSKILYVSFQELSVTVYSYLHFLSSSCIKD